jgi:hypothetical protein
MNDRSFDQLLEAWMDLGPTSAPDRVAGAARLEARTTRQMAGLLGWPPRRFPFMNSYAKLAAAAAAVALAAFLGYNYLIAPNVGGPSLFADPTPEPTQAISPSPSFAAAPVDFSSLEAGGTPLDPGPHRIDYASPVVVTITIPDQPYLGNPSAWYKAGFQWGPWHQSNEAMLGFIDVRQISANPCIGGFEPEDELGPGAGDLADAIEQMVGIDVARSDATVDGFPGFELEVTGSSERPPECVDEPMMWLTNQGDLFPMPDAGRTERLWILDVDGERLVVAAAADAAGLYADELEELIQSISIEAP